MSNLLFRFLAFVISVYSITSNNYEIDLFVIIHIIIIGISCYSLFSFENNPYSLHKVYHIFNLFFFGIAPVLQYYENIRFVNEPPISKEVKITVSLIILLSTVLFNIIYNYYYYSTKNNNKTKEVLMKYGKLVSTNKKLNGKTNLFFIAASLFSLFMMLYISNFNILQLLFKGGEIIRGSTSVVDTIKVDKSLGLIVHQFIRPLSLIIFIISYSYNKSRKILNLILFLIFIITCFPSGLSRNATAGFYLPLLLLFIPIFQKRNVFVSSMVGGILIIFPFLNNFRNFSGKEKLSIGLNYDMFTDMHFDAYMSFCRIVNLDLVTYGNQLLGTLFFFVPRSIWVSKPESSGWYHADVLNLYFKNLACTFLAEGYINFGYFGVFLFLFFISWFSAYMDKSFWIIKKYNTYFNVLYVLVLSMFLFILRGDLMSSYSYTFGLVLVATLSYKIIVFLSKIKIK